MTRQEFGDEQFMLWRRSYDAPPPPIADDDQFTQSADPRYADIRRSSPADRMPRRRGGPDAALLVRRDRARPDRGETVLVVAHGNSLRALVKHLDGICDAEIAELNIPTGIPLLYELDDAYRPVVPGGRYLDPEAAAEAAEAVRNQGR